MDVPGDKLLEPVVCMVSGWLGEGLHRTQKNWGLGSKNKNRLLPFFVLGCCGSSETGNGLWGSG